MEIALIRSHLAELKKAAQHLIMVCVLKENAVRSYDMLSDSVVWSDKLPTALPSEREIIRLVLRQRTSLILGEQGRIPRGVGNGQEQCSGVGSVLITCERLRPQQREVPLRAVTTKP